MTAADPTTNFRNTFMWSPPKPQQPPLIDRTLHALGICVYRVRVGDELRRCSSCTQTRGVR